MRNRLALSIVAGAFVVPAIPLFAVARATVPESWGGSEWLGFFSLAAIAFATMIRLKVLKPRIER
jgi:hypothetical protein